MSTAPTSPARSAKTGLGALITPQDCALLLIDHQPFQFAGLRSHDTHTIRNNVVGLAKMVKAFGVPTLLKHGHGGARRRPPRAPAGSVSRADADRPHGDQRLGGSARRRVGRAHRSEEDRHTAEAMAENLVAHWGAVGTSFRWEQQLLASSARAQAGAAADAASAAPQPVSV
jgi:hypothetical protein